MVAWPVFILQVWFILASAHVTIRQTSGFTPYATCSANCMNSIIQGSTSCNQEAHDCICDVNDTYLEEVAQCIAIRCGEAELTATANLGVENCALTGGWGNIDNNPNNFIYMGLKAISTSQPSAPSQTATSIPVPSPSVHPSEETTTTAPTPSGTAGSLPSNSNTNNNNIVVNTGNSGGGLSTSDRISLGVGLGIGLPSVVLAIWATW